MNVYKEKKLSYTDKYSGFEFNIYVEYCYDGSKLFVNSWQAEDKFTKQEIKIQDKDTSEQIEEFLFKSLDKEDELNYIDDMRGF